MATMQRLKLLFIALDNAGRAGLDYSGAAMSGGEHRRQRHAAYRDLSKNALDGLVADLRRSAR